MEEHKSFFDQLDPKSAMIVGLVGGLLAVGTIGFIILSVIMFGSKNTTGGSLAVATAPSVTVPAQNPAAAGTPSDQPAGANPGVPVKVDVGHFPALGKANAPVTVIEFADFRCPFCERFYGDAGKNILKDYVATGKVKFYFRSYAFLGPASTDSSEAAECANEQGAFWKFHNWMYEHQAPESDTGYYSKDNLIKYATDLGLNKAKFSSCLKSDKYASQIQQDLTDGQNAGVNGTPTTFINGKMIVGAVPYAQIKAAIDGALKQ